MVIVGYCFHFNYFSAFNNLQEQTIENALAIVSHALSVCGVFYIILGFFGLFMFGSSVHESVLSNVA